MQTFVDLFCGGGLGARGAVQAGMSPLLAVDLWQIACETYAHNFPSAVVLNERVEQIDPLDYARPGSVDLVLASPECTNHSLAKGGAQRSEQSRETALATVEWIGKLRPRWFVLENVKEMRGWNRYAELTARLIELGYGISEQIINAADFGAPQARRRLFLIGRLGAEPPVFRPSENVGSKSVRDILDPEGTWPTSPLFTERRAKKTVQRAKNAIEFLGKNAEFLLVYYGSGGEKVWQSLDRPLRTVTTLDRFALVRKKNGIYKMRMLQPTEIARAMSLPAEHTFPIGTRRDRIKLCGNGICSIVIEAIVRQMRIADKELGLTASITDQAVTYEKELGTSFRLGREFTASLAA